MPSSSLVALLSVCLLIYHTHVIVPIPLQINPLLILPQDGPSESNQTMTEQVQRYGKCHNHIISNSCGPEVCSYFSSALHLPTPRRIVSYHGAHKNIRYKSSVFVLLWSSFLPQLNFYLFSLVQAQQLRILHPFSIYNPTSKWIETDTAQRIRLTIDKPKWRMNKNMLKSAVYIHEQESNPTMTGVILMAKINLNYFTGSQPQI